MITNYRAFIVALLLGLCASAGADISGFDHGSAQAEAFARQLPAAAATRAYERGSRPQRPKGVTAPIRGRVIDSSTGEPLEFVTAFAFALPNFDQLFDGVTGPDGNYEIQVPPGRYRVTFAAGNAQGQFNGPYTREQYSASREGPAVYCDFQNLCTPSIDTALEVSPQGISRINASLDPAGFLSGQLQDVVGNPLVPDSFRNQVQIFDPRSQYLTNAFQPGDTWGIFLPLGQYVLLGQTSSGVGYVDTTLGGTPCPRASCNLDGETPVVITSPGSNQLGLDIQLPLGAIVTGRIINGVTQERVPAGADFYRPNGRYAGFADIGSNGFVGLTGLPDGTYFVSTTFQDSRPTRGVPVTAGPGIFEFTGLSFVDALFDGFECVNGCDVTVGTPITISGRTLTSGPIDIRVVPGGTIRGQVVAATDRTPIGNVGIRFFDGEGVVVNEVRAGADGRFAAGPFEPGSYYLVSNGSSAGYVDQIYNGIDCQGTGCADNALTGEAVAVTEAGDVASILFRLRAEQTVTPAEIDALDEAGRAVAVCGNRLFIGAPGDDEAGPNAGAVFAYRKSGRNYVQTGKLFAEEPENGDRFGASLACDSGLLVVGAPGAGPAAKGGGQGSKPAAYAFSIGSGTATVQTLLAQNLGGGGGNGAQSFGASVAVNGDTMVIGAPQAETGGAAVVFNGSGGLFVQDTILMDPDAEVGDGFGSSVGTSGDLIVLGAPNQASGNLTTGLAQLFQDISGGWGNVGKFTNPDAAAGDAFGAAVAIDGTTMAIGAPGTDLDDEDDAGAAHVFVFSGNNVVQTAMLTATDPVASAALGNSIAINGDLLIAGAPLANGAASGTGAAYLFEQSGSNWDQIEKFQSAASVGGDNFGTSVGFDGDAVAIGSPAADGSAGTATIFSNAERIFGTSFD